MLPRSLSKDNAGNSKQPKGLDGEDLRELKPGEAAAQIEQEAKPKSFWGRVKYFFVGEKLDRKRLAALGNAART